MTKGYEKAFRDLEQPLYRMLRLAEILDYLHVEDMAEVSVDRQGRYIRVSEDLGEMLGFLATECRDQSRTLIEQWLEEHNAQCRKGYPA